MVDGAVGVAESGEGAVVAATPLELIREKEAELSGRVLGAKREADDIVSDARKQAASIIQTATDESVAASRESLRLIQDETEAQAKTMLGDADTEALDLTSSIEPRIDTAVQFVVKAIVGD